MSQAMPMGSGPTLAFLKSTQCRAIAEIGVDKGNTSLSFAEWLNHRGILHLFDYEDTVQSVLARLTAAGFSNVSAFGNSRKTLDSYNWSLMQLLELNTQPIYDYVFIDGAHTWLHDGLAFFLADKLLRVGGYMDFDDYDWSYAVSPTVNPRLRPEILNLFTLEQIECRQVSRVVDLLVKRSNQYVPVMENRIYQKVR